MIINNLILSIMKTIIRFFIFFAVIATITGCTTTERFTISAPAGTKITLPMAGIVEPQSKSNGEQQVTIPSEGYCGYVLATPAGSTTPIPMGLNLKRNEHIGSKASLVAGVGLSSVGIIGILGGTIVAIGANSNGDDDAESTAGVIMAASAGVAGIGVALGLPAQIRLGQTAYDYSFSYEKRQNLDIPQLSTSLIHPDPEKNAPIPLEEVKSARKKASSGKAVGATSSKGSKVNQKRTAIANKVIGDYKGTGQLLHNKKQEEFYSDIQIKITSVDNNSVKVRIIEDGEDFFEEPLICNVSSDKKGNYQLKISDIPTAMITITKSGVFSFNHSKVIIDDIMYNLVIKANIVVR